MLRSTSNAILCTLNYKTQTTKASGLSFRATH
uniref:Uncharacterized protein n=1 Tax=Arundo donax TaxID=35708 RepID=A0A0A9DR83_ARUDO